LQAKGRQSRPAGSQRLFCSSFRCSVSETRCNGGAFRDRSLGSGTATGHNTLGPSREGSLEFPKERRDRVCPSRTVFGQGWPKRSAARPSLHGCTRGVSWTGTPDPGAGFLERKVSGILPGASLPFAGEARSHNPCHDPGPSWRAHPEIDANRARRWARGGVQRRDRGG